MTTDGLRRETPMRWLRLLLAPLVLVAIVWRMGATPLLDGLRAVDASTVVIVTVIGWVTTVCCAWRWRLVARGLDVHLSMRAGVAAYYRSQFLNVALPGGVLGDLHRAVSHGHDVGGRLLGVRTVAWERSIGQAVQAVLTVIVLVVWPSPVRAAMVVLLVVAGGVLLLAVPLSVVLPMVLPIALPNVLVRRRAVATGSTWSSRARRILSADLRAVVLDARIWPGAVVSSTIVVAGHVTSFVVAARAVGSTAPVDRLVPLALIVLLAMSVPLNVGGFGPREGVAAWTFGAAGLGAGVGVAAAVAYGVLTLVAVLPGLAVLVVQGASRPPPAPARWESPAWSDDGGIGRRNASA